MPRRHKHTAIEEEETSIRCFRNGCLRETTNRVDFPWFCCEKCLVEFSAEKKPEPLKPTIVANSELENRGHDQQAMKEEYRQTKLQHQFEQRKFGGGATYHSDEESAVAAMAASKRDKPKNSSQNRGSGHSTSHRSGGGVGGGGGGHGGR